VIALDVARFIEPGAFAAEVDRHLGELRASAKLPGVERIRMPGEDRASRRAERSGNGVALPATLIKQLDDLAADLQLEPIGARQG
jgi:L-2-hydroxycarboxylate dehydrogenase (NAD+)